MSAGWGMSDRTIDNRAIMAGAGLCAIVVLAIAGMIEADRYREAMAMAGRDTRNAATLAAAHAARTLSDVQSTLQGAISLHDDVVDGHITDPKAVLQLLDSLRGDGAVIQSVGWTDAAGIQQARSSPGVPKLDGAADMSRREHFRHHRDAIARGEPPGLHISRPIQARASGQWLIVVSLPIIDRGGRFAGTAGAAVDPTYFASLYQGIELGASRVATLYSADGVVLSRAPDAEAWIGKVDDADKMLFTDTIRHATAGTTVRPAAGGRNERIISFRAVPNLPLVVTFSLTTADVLAPFYAGLRIMLATAGLALALLAAGAWFVLAWRRERLDSRAALESSEARYRSLVDTADGIVWEAEPPNLDFTFVSDKAERLLGYPAATWLEPGFWAAHVHPDDRERAADERLAGAVTHQGHDIEYRFLAADGRAVWLHDLGTVAVERNEARMLRGVMVDTTRSRLADAALQRSQKMEAIGQLTGGIAHDFNNLLGVILVHAGILGDLVGQHADARKCIDAVTRSVERGADLTRRLLGFARDAPHETKRVSVNTFIVTMEGLIRKSLTPAIRVETVLAADAWPVEIDPGDLQDAILNLALNARDAMPAGGTLVIETANRTIDDAYTRANPGSAKGDFVMIAVSDTGTGMLPEVAEKAFEPFFTTKAEGKGTGLGLSMVYGFVRRSGGHARIYSEPGAGTTVRLYLPRVPGEAADMTAMDSRAIALPGGDEMILVVDDEPALAEAAVQLLDGLGYHTRKAANAGEALAILEAEPAIDLLFSDVILPGTDGYRLAMAARRLRPDIRVLLTSGFPRKREEFVNGDAAIARELARTLLGKPYTLTELAMAIRRALDI